MQLDKVYEPQRFEPHWSQWWIDSGIFRADAASHAPVFSIVIPPPNVTGYLHMGHMLDHTEIDVVTRWHRMRGYNTLWLPGTDHAGIATQTVVERQLAAEGLTRHDLGREKFVERVWKWKAESGDTIKKQMIQLGDSCDWTRERFTFDAGLSRAVRETFVRFYEKGLLYRGEYMINWCPRCMTALSDLEVKHTDKPGHLWHIRYPVKGGAEFLTVATTRPETMLGDTAVAINAADPRYQHLHGLSVLLPLMDREIPIILDDLADPKFGTGVVKVTPAHDPNDFECGKRHSLPLIQVIGPDGKMTAAAGKYAGLDRFEARRQVVADLEALGLMSKIEDYPLSVGECDRCRTVVEPLVSTQWFVGMKPLAEKAIAAVESGRIRMIPDNWTKTYFEWMRNIRDWCVSRQLWWGHRIPAWYCECGEIIVAREDPTHCPKCQSDKLTQDTDVLDTWFSSGLWPFSTMGWPDQTPDLAKFYPTSLLITGFDIIFFWVARMIVFGLELTGEVPFHEVYMHGLIRDAERQKMSKTKGNVIDPLEVTPKYGTDAVRLALLLGAAPGTDIVLSEDRMESTRAFANKIWNAARFLFLNMERCGVEPALAGTLPDDINARPAGDALEDRWLFSRLNACAADANRAIETYRFHEAAHVLWHFFWDEFCDWYVELKKLRFRDNSGLNADWKNILTAFEKALRLLHPLMPFVSEELWQRLKTPGRPISIAISDYPQPDPALNDAEAERDIDFLQKLVTDARAQRAQLKLDPKLKVEAFFAWKSGDLDPFRREALERLANLTLHPWEQEIPSVGYIIKLKLPAANLDAQRKRIEKEREQLEKVIANSRRQLSDDTFLGKAPAKVVDGIRLKLGEYEAQLSKLESDLASFAQ